MAARAMLAGAVLATVTAGCGQSLAARSAAACPQQLPKAGTPTTVTWRVNPVDQQQLATLASRFTATHPDIRVTVVGETADQWLTAVRDHRPLPDLVDLDVSFTPAAIDSHTLMPAQDCIDAAHYPLSDFLPDPLAASRAAGRQWGLPLGYPPTLLMYDTAAFTRAGISGPPATLDQLHRDAKALQGIGISHPIATLWVPSEPEIAGVPQFDGDNGHAARVSRSTLDTPEGERLVGAVATLMADGDLGPAPPPPEPPTLIDPTPWLWDLNEFSSGQAAISMHQGWDLPDVADLNAHGAHIAVAALPTLDGPAVMWMPSASIFFSAQSPPAARAAAWELVKWLEEPAQQAVEFFPTRRSATPADPTKRQVWNMVTRGPAAVPAPITGVYNAMFPTLVQMFGNAAQGQMTAGAAARQAQTQVDQLIADYDADPVGFTLLHLH
jgi:ABC-type glycerol-3-phosphate transport system substrate-binding protein